MEQRARSATESTNNETLHALQDTCVSDCLERNTELLTEIFDGCSDFMLRCFNIRGKQATAAFIHGLINAEQVNEALKALMYLDLHGDNEKALSASVLPALKASEATGFAMVVSGILQGGTVVFVENESAAMLLSMDDISVRAIEEPVSEAVVRGSREGFVEYIGTNVAMLRRRLKTPHLKTRSYTLGRESQTSVVVAYLHHIADPEIVQEVHRRIGSIDIGGILESGYIEELIQDKKYSLFPQIQYTERPDSVAANLLEGRIAIFVDGTPFVLLVPCCFWQLLQSSEDYYERFYVGTFVRWLRYTLVFIALTTPAFYIAISTYHQEMIPTLLLLSVASARETIPFPAFAEALMMEVTFEALREAGVRLPRAIGQTVSIVGALVVGQAAVQAGIVSAPMVIIVSITGIASFTIPHYNLGISIRILRFGMMSIAAVMGIFGVLVALFVLYGYLANLRSFGVPYLAPVSPLSWRDVKDVIIRRPWSDTVTRPLYQGAQDPIRQQVPPEKNAENGGQA